MIRYLRHEEIDREAWDHTVEGALAGLPYALSWVLDLMSPGWEGLVSAGYELVFPLPVRKKLFLRGALQPPFLQQLGPYAGRPVRQEDVRALTEALPPHLHYVDLWLNEQTPMEGWTGKVERMRNILLTLDPGAPRRYHTNMRRNLKKFTVAGWSVQEENDPAVAAAMVDLFRRGQGKAYGHLREEHYDRLVRLHRHFLERGMARLLTVRDGKVLVCAALFIVWRQRWIFHFSATDPHRRDHHLLAGILDHFIREHAGSGKILDLEGAQAEGLARFYKGLGGEERFFPRWRLHRLPRPWEWLGRS